MATITTTADLLTSNGSAQPVMVELTQSELRLIAQAPTLAADLADALERERALVAALKVTRDKLLSHVHDEYDGVWSEADFAEETAEADAALTASGAATGETAPTTPADEKHEAMVRLEDAEAAQALVIEQAIHTALARARSHTKGLSAGSGRADSREAWLRVEECKALAWEIRALASPAALAASPEVQALIREAEARGAKNALRDFDKADWFWRTMDPDDNGDTPHEAVQRAMLGNFCVCEVASSFAGPTRYGFTAPVLDPESDDEEFIHFATHEEAMKAAKERCVAAAALRKNEEPK